MGRGSGGSGTDRRVRASPLVRYAPTLMRHYLLAALVLLLACGDDDGPSDVGVFDASSDTTITDDATPMVDAGDDAPIADAGDDTGPDAGPPCLGPPGLYVTGTCTTLSEGVREYSPRYWLWSDGTDKERYIRLPAGSQIDTSDPNNWVYPRGTQVWKTFLIDGVRLETRLFEKFDDGAGLDAWDMRTFAWNEAQDSVEELTDGRVDVLGTGHDIPARGACITCHVQTGRQDVLNGFTAIQLNHADAGFSLSELNDSGLLSAPIDLDDANVPGEGVVADALGYMHSNCGPCHGNRAAPAGLSMWVDVGVATPEETATYMTSVGVPSLRIFDAAVLRVQAGSPEGSVVVTRMSSREVGVQMPQIGTELVHPEGVATVEAWIRSLPTD